MSENRAIGKENKIPWDFPDDRKRFKDLTLNHVVIMGRKTFESIGHPLPGRKNIIVTGQKDYETNGCLIAASLSEAIGLAGEVDEIFIAGGERIYREALPLVDRIYLTVIHKQCEGDRFFPELPEEFIEVQSETIAGDPPLTFLLFARIPVNRNSCE